MPNVYQPTLVQIRPQYNDGGDNIAENVMWFSGNFTTPLTLAQIQAVQAVFDSAWPTFWKPQAFDSSTYLGSIMTDWSSNTGLQNDTVSILTPVHGTGGTAAAGAQVSILMSFSTGVRYRGGHPRRYLPGVSATILPDPSHIQAATATTMAANYLTFQAAMSGISSSDGGGYDEKLYLHKTDPVKAHFVDIAEFAVQTLLATQRRRLRKVTRK